MSNFFRAILGSTKDVLINFNEGPGSVVSGKNLEPPTPFIYSGGSAPILQATLPQRVNRQIQLKKHRPWL